MSLVQSAATIFREKFEAQPLLFRSPGRVNFIGEHTDYNMGYVLPAAIDKAIFFAITPRSDRRCIVYAMDLNDEHEFSVDDLQFSKKGWPNYLMGVVDQFVKARYCIRGFNCVFGGDIPIGAGMSSSAALETGLTFALNSMFDLQIDALSLAKLAQKAENEFVGVRCGIMDQYINIFGARDNVLRVDCRSLEHKYYPFAFNDISLVLFDTCISHSLASSEYNRRREECSEGIEIIKNSYPDVCHLRDVSVEMLHKCKDKMDPIIHRRCKYVVEENGRVLSACTELERGNLKAFGAYMNRTHNGLSHDYEVSCAELDYLVELVKDSPYVYGSRMMGGGFGGCTINLIKHQTVAKVNQQVAEKYKKEFHIDLKTYITSIDSGTRIISANEYAAD